VLQELSLANFVQLVLGVEVVLMQQLVSPLRHLPLVPQLPMNVLQWVSVV
jgi:hypothetical protein